MVSRYITFTGGKTFKVREQSKKSIFFLLVWIEVNGTDSKILLQLKLFSNWGGGAYDGRYITASYTVCKPVQPLLNAMDRFNNE